MGDERERGAAAEALAAVARRQEQVIDAAAVPGWYWWAIAGLVVLLGLVVDSRIPLVVGLGVVVFVVGVVGLTFRVVTVGGRAQVRNDLFGHEGVPLILASVAVVVLLALGTGFAAQAAGLRWPATVACLVAAVLVAAGGPWLMRRLRAIMLRHRVGS